MIPASVHPLDIELARHAAGELTTTESRALAVHLIGCTECRARLDDIKGIIDMSNAMHTPDASDQLLTRILADRASGVRTLLVTDDAPSAKSRRIRVSPRTALRSAFAIAAMLGVAAFGAWSWRTRSTTASNGVSGTSATTAVQPVRASNAATAQTADATDSNRMMMDDIGGWALTLAPWPSVANAQSPSGDLVAPYAPVLSIDLSRVQPRSYTYLRTMTTDGTLTRAEATNVVMVDTTTVRGTAAFQVATWSSVGRFMGTDTVWLRRSDLRLLNRSRHMAGIHVVQSSDAQGFVDTRITRGGSHPVDTKSRTDRPAPQGRISVSDESALRLLMRALPLKRGWRGSVALHGYSAIAHAERRSADFVNLRVDGEESVPIWSDSVDCWRVFVGQESHPQVWFVSKATGEIVRIRLPFQRDFTSGLDLVSTSR